MMLFPGFYRDSEKKNNFPQIGRENILSQDLSSPPPTPKHILFHYWVLPLWKVNLGLWDFSLSPSLSLTFSASTGPGTSRVCNHWSLEMCSVSCGLNAVLNEVILLDPQALRCQHVETGGDSPANMRPCRPFSCSHNVICILLQTQDGRFSGGHIHQGQSPPRRRFMCLSLHLTLMITESLLAQSRGKRIHSSLISILT